jgi:hypothetical protein
MECGKLLRGLAAENSALHCGLSFLSLFHRSRRRNFPHLESKGHRVAPMTPHPVWPIGYLVDFGKLSTFVLNTTMLVLFE